MATKNRTDLKSYFVKNAIPTEGNFADLVDSQLNQAQDGVFKPDGDALSVTAAPGDQKRVLRLFASYPAANPDWMISLNPAQDPANAATTSRPGFGITDGTGRTRLFVDTATGQIGVGTNTPQVALDVDGAVQASGFRGRYDLLSDYRTVNPPYNVCLQSPPGDRDAWIYRDTAVGSATSNWGIYHRQIDTAVGNLPGNSIGFVGNTTLKAYIALGDGSAYFAGKVGIGTTAPEASLHVTNGSRFSGERHYFTDSEGKARIRMGACAGIAGIYAEDTQDIFVGCDPSRTLHLWQPNKVTVTNGSLRAIGGFTFDYDVGVAHIDRDGALYRNTDGQVYLTVDDNFYIRDSGSASWSAYFNTNNGSLTIKGSYLTSSDMRLKENIEPVVGSLARLRQLRCMSFDWKDQTPGPSGMKQLGLIAQDVQAVVPEAVVAANGDMLAVSYPAITALLVEGLKEQQQQIDELRAALTSTPA